MTDRHPINHARSPSADRTMALDSFELHAKDSRTTPLTTHVEDHNVEYGLDPSWDEAYAATGLSPVARTYLINRHGTLDLDPMPSASDWDPYNWRQSKKVVMLLLVAFHSCMATIIASAIIPAYSDMAEEFGNTIQDSTYLTAVQIAVLGVSPLAWRPLANTYGRRPIFLLSLIMAGLGNIACALSRSYGVMMFFRAVVAFFISPASAIGSAVVAETFLKKDRAKYIGIWMVMVTLGVPIGPLIFGFVTFRTNWRFIFWILAIINGVQFILYFFFGPETLYLRSEDDPPPYTDGKTSGFVAKYLNFRRINPRKLTVHDYFEPLRMIVHPCAVLPGVAYSTVFLFGSILTTIEIPQLFEEKFGLNTEQIGLQFIGVIIGSLLGEQIGGALSDLWMRRRKARLAEQPPPEFRLWLSYFGYVLTVVGAAVFLVTTEKAPAGKWTVVPVVGTAIAAIGNQVVTTVLVTYAVDCAAENAASVGVFMSLLRQVIGFLGPFWFPSMFSSVGLSNSSAIVAGLVIGLSIIPTVVLQFKGHTWR
ncbi:hypothetical protein N0V93_002058 [Gnomoniopsis smithogilvyi]|uniref:Major facilitator superfamily (MFS) profile domain-containing protein n=1 Tax=Gnomoniopsis smithogilvyi TaxID=1191159 RepID=A0A9W9D3A7_9PEZI|nr:hypothetical protein N0V93_002058 [Gnomoniopsis smithogilvyi]